MNVGEVAREGRKVHRSEDGRKRELEPAFPSLGYGQVHGGSAMSSEANGCR